MATVDPKILAVHGAAELARTRAGRLLDEVRVLAANTMEQGAPAGTNGLDQLAAELSTLRRTCALLRRTCALVDEGLLQVGSALSACQAEAMLRGQAAEPAK